MTSRRRVSVFGSTGSVGQNTVSLLIAQGGPDTYETVALTGAGNIVHVTVNNFINTEKKPPANDTAAKTYNTRPFSSDAKDREKKAQQNVTTNPINQKLFPYDTSGMATTFKNPYEMKMIGKIGTNLKNPKKKEEIRNPIMAY